MFCSKCGKEISDGTSFCPHCGHLQTGGVKPKVSAAPTQNILTGLASKIKMEAYAWIGVAVIQVIIGIYNISVGLDLNSWGLDGSTNIIAGIVVMAVAAMNGYTSYKDINYSKEIFNNPVGIVAKYKPINSVIITLVYNLVLGGVIGVVGSIFGFITRNYVIVNEQEFLALETEKGEVK